MATISSLGIGSGVLNSELVDQLVQAERAPSENRLTRKTEQAQAMLSAFGKLRSAITELRLPMRQLSSPENMKAFTAESSSEDIGVSLDSSKASRGTYSVEVTSLAQSQSLASGTFDNKDSTSIGTGSLTLSAGSETKTFTIDGTNNTLKGLADEINDADIGVTAGVIDTGSGFRLVMSSDETGIDSAMTISVTDDDGSSTDASGLSNFAFDGTTSNLAETVAAKDAVLNINGIQVSRSSNTIENVIDGLTFEAKAEGVTSTIRVEQDFGKVADRVQAFVEKFNGLQATIKSLSGVNAEAGTGSILTGDSAIRGIQGQLRSLLTRVVPGLEGASVRTLADVGIATSPETGGLNFDRDEFIEKLKSSPDDVTALFSEQGRATDSQIGFVRSGADTRAGEYEINISQAATQGGVTGTGALGGSVTIDASNDQLSIVVDGETSVDLELLQKSYTSAQELVDEIQAQIDSNAALNSAEKSVQVSLDVDGKLVFTSGSYGSESKVSISSVEDGASLGLSVSSGVAGKDVAGTIDGRVAQGDGRVLFLKDGNGPAGGLQINVGGDELGSRGTITFIKGVAEETVDLVTNIVGVDGIIEAKTDGLNRQLENIRDEAQRLDERIASYRERLVAQFSAADSLIAQLNSTRDYVSQQLAALAPQNNRNN
jgi:flagellar hook-associated protein 2